MFLKMWKKEFQAENFKLKHPKPKDFTICCWEKSTMVTFSWLSYRIIIALYFLVSFVYTVIHMVLDDKVKASDKGKVLIFLTNWTYLCQVFTFGLSYCLSVSFSDFLREFLSQKAGNDSGNEDNLHWSYKLFWAFYNIVLSSSINVTLLFWFTVYNPVGGEKMTSTCEVVFTFTKSFHLIMFPINAPNIILHALNSVFMILDFALVAHPIKFLHFYWPNLYGVIYLLFSVVYELSGGTGVKLVPIYEVLDWKNNPAKAFIMCLMASIGLVLAHMLFSLLSLLKMYLRRKYITD